MFVTTAEGLYLKSASGKAGYPYFSALIKDVLERTETAMSSHQAFAAIELAMTAQKMRLESK